MRDCVQYNRANDRRAKRTVRCKKWSASPVDVNHAPHPKLHAGTSGVEHSPMNGVRVRDDDVPRTSKVRCRRVRYAIAASTRRQTHVVQSDITVGLAGGWAKLKTR